MGILDGVIKLLEKTYDLEVNMRERDHPVSMENTCDLGAIKLLDILLINYNF